MRQNTGNKLYSTLLIAWMVTSQALLGSTVVFAQQPAVSMDVDPPLIEHQVVAEAESDYRQSFMAVVVDDNDLDSVNLFYRFKGESTYSSVQMLQVSYSSSYIARVPTDPASDVPIEYYLQASDVSGNRTLRGYAFNPLLRRIVVPESAQETIDALPTESADAAEAASDSAGSNDRSAAKDSGSRKKAVYIVVGALLLGVVAGALGSGSSGDPPSTGNCDDGICGVQITINEPIPQ